MGSSANYRLNKGSLKKAEILLAIGKKRIVDGRGQISSFGGEEVRISDEASKNGFYRCLRPNRIPINVIRLNEKTPCSTSIGPTLA